MKTDKFGNVIFNTNDVIELIYSDKEHILEKVYTDEEEFKNLPTKK
jgi:hypothetical protein